MMDALLDTHTFLWWNMDDPRLSPLAREIISDGRNTIYLSAASAWEIAIKTSRGRLILPEPPDRYVTSRINKNNFQPLPIHLSHALHIFQLPDLHRDPFDRLLISQCQLEDLPLLSSDPIINQYDLKVIW